MTLKELKTVLRYAAEAKVTLTHERTAYFRHTVCIGGERYSMLTEAMAHIERLRSLSPLATGA